MNGWIKLHKKTLYNDVWRHDHTAWHVFEALMMSADIKTGSWSGGRFQLADLCELKPTTAYQALKRLESKKMVTLGSNNKYTVVHICKWSKFQQGSDSLNDTKSDNKVTTKRQQNDTLIRTKELKNKRIDIVEVQKNVRQVYDHYLKVFNKNENQYKLTDKRKLKLKQRLDDAGKDNLTKAIDFIGNDPFYKGDNDRGWTADLDFIIRSYEQVEKFATKEVTVTKYKADWLED